MRKLVASLLTSLLFLGCQLDTGEDPLLGDDDGGGTAGTSGSGAGRPASGAGGAAAGTTSAGGRGGTPAGAGGGTSSGGSAQAGAGGSAQAGAGGSARAGAAGSATGGKGGGLGGAGSGNAGASGAGPQAGSAGTSSAGTGTSGDGGSGGCSGDIRCKLDAPASTGDLHQDCVDRINQFRTECACLPPLERWTEGEDCANQMAEYDSTADGAHAGFQDDICEGGSAQNECPGWRSETQVVEGCLQQMWDEGPPDQEPCNDACFQEYGHFINMTNERYTRVACGFFTTPDGEVWAVQNFTR